MSSRAAAANVDFLPLPFSSDLDLRTIGGIRRAALERRPHVIHVHKGRPHTLALAATWFSPVPAFVVNRGVSFPLTAWNRPKYRTRRVDRVVTVCRQIKDVIVRTGRLPGEKVLVIYAGTDMELFDPARWDRQEFRSEKGIPADAFLITQVGVRDWKGWRELIEAFAVVAGARPSVHLALIATRDRAQADEVRAFAAAHGVESAVTPVEARDDMPRVFAASDLVTDASWAGTGITGTIREAMAMGKPTVSTDCGGNVELVSSPEVGWLVPPRDRDALTRAMLEVIDEPARSAKVGAAAMAHVRENFSKEKRLDRLEELYRGIVMAKAGTQNAERRT